MKILKKPSSLTIISDCVHNYGKSGKIGSFNHILIKQLDALMKQFEKVYLCAPLGINTGDSRIRTYEYDNENLEYVALPNVGGNSLMDKLILLKAMPIWFIRCIRPLLRGHVVYQRFPNNVNLFMVLFVIILRKRRFATYTGTWENYENEPLTYRLQKTILKKLYSAPYHVYIQANKGLNLSKNRVASFSPSLFKSEVPSLSSLLLLNKIKSKRTKISIATVGSLSKNKNQQFSIKVARCLIDNNIDLEMKILGDGAELYELQKLVKDLGLESKVTFMGRVSSDEVLKTLMGSDYVLQPVFNEGFGKVPLEALSMGAIPILSNGPFSTFFTESGAIGFTFDLIDPKGETKIVDFIKKTKDDIDWKKNFCSKANFIAKNLTIDSWLDSLDIDSV